MTIKDRILFFLVLSLFFIPKASGQFMPVVFDKNYGENNRIEHICTLPDNEVAMIGKEGEKTHLTRINREGGLVFSMQLPGFISVNQLSSLNDNRLLVVGQSQVVGKNNKADKNITVRGRAVIVNHTGSIIADFYGGAQNSEFMKGILLKTGGLILSGAQPKSTGREGIIIKTDASYNVSYQYRYPESAYCDQFEVLGNTTEYICAVFSAEKEKEVAAIVRLDDKGKPFYITSLPSARFKASSIAANINDGSVIFCGNSPVDGGIVYKVRAEGDIVFGKTLIPASDNASLNGLKVSRTGNILVGGTGGKGYYALLRNDGTSLYSGVTDGIVSGTGMNQITGESVVTTYNAQMHRGEFIRISATGKAEFNRAIEGNFDHIRISNNGEVLLLSSSEGRVCMFSATGNNEFDRYITENKSTAYRKALTSESGEVFFLGAKNRLVKLAHGLYVSDVKITKPVNGTAIAVFTVTLTGYSNTKEGAPVPVNVSYATADLSANTTYHYTPVQGKLAFTPSRGSADRYLVKQDIEIPVKANSFIEGMKEFELRLSDVQQSYLVKPTGKAVIEDQQSVVKLIRTENGVEGSNDIVYELGLFKTDGAPLTNATGANIIVDGIYGEGSADKLDFDMGQTPRVIFADRAQRSVFHVKTLEDTRYELPKTVVINFNQIYSLSGSNVAFNGELLSCTGTVIDQPAKIAISSLGDHRLNNSAVSGFFTVSLLRVSDGALQTNATGSDIIVNCAAVADAAAKEGKDFVFTNIHDLRVAGDGNHSSANIDGVVLYSTDVAEKQVKVNIKSVVHPNGAQPVGISAGADSAEFTIRK